jgi:hypothetical protein
LSQVGGLVIDGDSGTDYLDSFAVTRRFGIGLNIVFLVAIYVVFLATAYLMLYLSVLRSGALRRSAIRKVKREISRGQGDHV